MKKYLFLLLAGAPLTSCSMISDTMNSLEYNRQAIDASTQVILENTQAIEEANQGIAENRRQLDAINATLRKAASEAGPSSGGKK